MSRSIWESTSSSSRCQIPGTHSGWGGHDVIVLRATDQWFRSSFTLAHELGHIALGTSPAPGEAAAQHAENRANAFAAELLMPAEHIRALDWAVTPAVIAQRVWELGVSTQALRTRLRYLRLGVPEPVAAALQLTTLRLVEEHLPPAVATAEDVTERMALAARRRFPLRLLTDLRGAVDSGRASQETLAWALGTPVEGEEVSVGDQADSMADELRTDLLDGLV
ncbi:ImmA/IrrE family metallo-endopeptidase [Actinomyces wuliandei]|uniref:ImmA/IrrE family metallo-endopeptidase n=1 Tax=Actinomyces wuliandei TaxID=2057743 RepID=UPI0013E3ED80|nr:ImmA/IrrE family metallo-endopeptidase [Actinomyces wuliandei]